jgi:hypothetical protein
MDRPWWGNPLIWIAASGGFLLLGLFVAPRFLPGVVIFLPFVWIRRPRSRLDPTEGRPVHGRAGSNGKHR